MNKWEKIKKFTKSFKGFIGLLIITQFVATMATANINNKKAQGLIKVALGEKIKNDLVNKSFKIRFQNVKEYKLSANQINVIGDAYCVISADKSILPIHFEALVNTTSNKVEFIDYKIVEEVKKEVFLSDEELVAKALMEKMHRDFDTTNIVLTINSLESEKATENTEKLNGFGEVKLDDFTIRKIEFNVKMNEKTKKVKIDFYKLKKY